MAHIYIQGSRVYGGIFFALCIAFTSEAKASAKDVLAQAIIHYDRGDYKKALAIIKAIDIRNDLDSSDDMKDAFKIRAVSSAEMGNEELAITAIRDLFFLDPSYVFDPFDTPQSVVALAQKEKAVIEEKTKHLTQLMPDKDLGLAPKMETIYIEKPHHQSVILFPFGLNHFIWGSSLKGGLYSSIQALGLIGNISAFWWKQSYLSGFGRAKLSDFQNKNQFETAQIVQFTSLAVGLLGYVVSVVDAFIAYRQAGSDVGGDLITEHKER